MKERIRQIPTPEGISIEADSAAALVGRCSVSESPYFKAPDFYSMRSDEKGLTIISEYPTYQQTKGYSCGPCCVLSVLWHFGVTEYDEMRLVELCGTITEPNERKEGGTHTRGICEFFRSIGWNVESSFYAPEKNQIIFKNPAEFRDYLLEKLRAGIPVMVENICLGAHWRAIIGYDTMGTEDTADDVLIFMDSADVRDHCQDGYTVGNMEEFFDTWRDFCALPVDQRVQQYVAAWPPESGAGKQAGGEG
ncbi:MAG: papain-like cysteine protease family protein [Synergistaceae bacterium]|nr:papain-like cysteine protease family protein [Synergistaceae bacterium]